MPPIPPYPTDHIERDRYTHQIVAAIAATTTVKLLRPGRRARIVGAEIIFHGAGVTQDPTNYYTIEVLAGASVAASWSFLTGAQGTLAADTFGSLVLHATDSNRIVADSGDISFRATKTGTAANLPATGRLNLSFRYV